MTVPAETETEDSRVPIISVTGRGGAGRGGGGGGRSAFRNIQAVRVKTSHTPTRTVAIFCESGQFTSQHSAPHVFGIGRFSPSSYEGDVSTTGTSA